MEASGGKYSSSAPLRVDSVSRKGGTPLVVANKRVLGVIYLKDIIRSGVREKFTIAPNGHKEHHGHRETTR